MHPDWVNVIAPLRTGLPEKGWATLSIQLPVLANTANVEDYGPLFTEVPPRIKAAISYLKKQGHKKPVIIAHSLGTDMAAYTLSKHKRVQKQVQGFVAISMTAPRIPKLTKISTIDALKAISVPMLELYGLDHESAIAGAKQRKTAGMKNGKFSQSGIKGADHFFRGENMLLIKTVNDWISKLSN